MTSRSNCGGHLFALPPRQFFAFSLYLSLTWIWQWIWQLWCVKPQQNALLIYRMIHMKSEHASYSEYSRRMSANSWHTCQVCDVAM